MFVVTFQNGTNLFGNHATYKFAILALSSDLDESKSTYIWSGMVITASMKWIGLTNSINPTNEIFLDSWPFNSMFVIKAGDTKAHTLGDTFLSNYLHNHM